MTPYNPIKTIQALHVGNLGMWHLLPVTDDRGELTIHWDERLPGEWATKETALSALKEMK